MRKRALGKMSHSTPMLRRPMMGNDGDSRFSSFCAFWFGFE